jgi:DNA helicase HerA-like ATPase
VADRGGGRGVSRSRAELEARVPPLATSLDGRRFTFTASLHGLEVEPGSYVVLDRSGDEARVGQVVTLGVAHARADELSLEDASDGALPVRHAAGEGRVLAGPVAPFHDAELRPARPDEVAPLVAARGGRAGLPVGELALLPGVPFALDAGGFGRHTFLCGQSGSGKTYALGVVLEQLLLETAIRIVILDPNSDFVRLAEPAAGAGADAADRYGRIRDGIVVRRAGDGLGLRFPQLDARVQAAVLRLDPIADRDEYAELVSLVEGVESLSLERLELLSREGSPAAQHLMQRVRNLGLVRWGIWPGAEGNSVVADLDAAPRCLVVDIGSLATREEQALAAAAVLEGLWERRERREPVLVVVDEAHNVCPARPEDLLTAAACEHAVRIAGEGRKFGLYLLVSTQRPQKVHENVLSQCDNLVLMRMNSYADLAVVAGTFSFVPPSLLDRSTDFRQGDALVAGPIAPHPALIRVGARLSAQGGGDVSSDWAAAR